ncbi:hypothetical protein F5879DRAFT_1025510 [Lentinula edodes]|nr:hypothetical protein F5879DRAFT_1025510 [Lentinula edodes]KAJ3912364.1 hypothetical protein F5877DRAFT_84886 [Lentinula edodes]
MRLNIIYFVFSLGLGLFSNVWAMPLSNEVKPEALSRAFIHIDSEADKENANKFLKSGLQYVFKKKPEMGFAYDASIQIETGSEPQSKRFIFFEIYADEQRQRFKGSGSINQNLYALRVMDTEGRELVKIGPDKVNEAHFEHRDGKIVVTSLDEQLSNLSLDPRP